MSAKLLLDKPIVPLESVPASKFATGYWTIWLIVTLGTFLGYEILMLAVGKPQNTLSNYVWTHLRIHMGESITQWSAGDLLTFVAYVGVFVFWLPWHFWFGDFR